MYVFFDVEVVTFSDEAYGPLVGLVTVMEVNTKSYRIGFVSLPGEIDDAAARVDRTMEVSRLDPVVQEPQRVEHCTFARRIGTNEQVEVAELDRPLMQAPVVVGFELQEVSSGAVRLSNRLPSNY